MYGPLRTDTSRRDKCRVLRGGEWEPVIIGSFPAQDPKGSVVFVCVLGRLGAVFGDLIVTLRAGGFPWCVPRGRSAPGRRGEKYPSSRAMHELRILSLFLCFSTW